MDTIKQEVALYLSDKQKYIAAGKIARDVHEKTLHKEAIIDRRLREMRAEGTLESTKFQVDGKGPWCVAYRLAKGEDPLTKAYFPNLAKSMEFLNVKLSGVKETEQGKLI